MIEGYASIRPAEERESPDSALVSLIPKVYMQNRSLCSRRTLVLLCMTMTLMGCNGGSRMDGQSAADPGGSSTDTKSSLNLLAGNMGSHGDVDGSLAISRLTFPSGIAADAAGNLYVADFNYTIRKISSNGIVSTLAGRPWERGLADGVGAAARFSDLGRGIAADAGGTLYVIDAGADSKLVVRKIAPDGGVTTFVSGAQLSALQGGRTALSFDLSGLAVNTAGDIFVGQRGAVDVGGALATFAVIRKISPNGALSVFAGSTSEQGYVDGDAVQARLTAITALAADDQGGLWFADGTTVRRVTATGSVATVAGLGGAAGVIDGIGPNARFGNVRGMAVLDESSVLVTDDGGTVRKVTRTGATSTLAGQPNFGFSFADGPGVVARFGRLTGLAIASGGVAFATDWDFATVRRLDSNAAVSTYAGSPPLAGFADGNGAAARFQTPTGIAATSIGYLHVIDGDAALRVVSPSGEVTTIPIPNLPLQLGSIKRCGIAVDSAGGTYITESGTATSSGNIPPLQSSSFSVVRKIATSGLASVVAGSLLTKGGRDGSGTTAEFRDPCGIAVDPAGNLFVADTGNHTIRRIAATGEVTTVAGLAGAPGHADGKGAQARFQSPRGIALGSGGDLLVADTGTNTIRKIRWDGTVTTLAGRPFEEGDVDGPGSAARFRAPEGIAVGNSDVVYVADTGNATVRRIAADGNVSTPVGTSGAPSFVAGALPGYIGSPRQLVVVGTSLYVTMHNGVAIVRDVK